MPPFVDTFRALPARSKAIIAVSAVAILAIAFLMLRVAGAPSYTMLTSGLDPAKTGEITAALDEQGIAYELRNNGTGLAVDKSQAAQARVALAGAGVNVSSARRGLRAVRRAEARRLRDPAEGHVPARARGRDRPHDRQRRGRQQPAGAARAARGRPVRRRGDARHGRRHARQLGRLDGPGRGARHRPARRLLRQGPQDRQRHDHRRLGHAAVAAGRRRRRRRHGGRQAGARGALLARHGGRPQRAAHPHARPGQGPGLGDRRPQRRQDHAGRGHLRRRAAACRSRRRPRPRSCSGGGATTGGTAGTGSNIPTYSAGAAAAAAPTPTTSARPRTPSSASTRRSPAPRSRPARSTRCNVALLVDKSVPAGRLRRAPAGRHQRRRHRHRAR